MKRAARQVIFYAILISLWVLLAKLKIWPPYIFPTPWGVLEALTGGFRDHSFWIALAVSRKRTLLGYGMSGVRGMVQGLGSASNQCRGEPMGRRLASGK